MTTSFSLIEGDMGDVDKLEDLAKHLFSEVDSVDSVTAQYKSIIFISNAGVLGPLSYVGTHALVDINSAISLNITGGTFLTSEFIRRWGNNGAAQVYEWCVIKCPFLHPYHHQHREQRIEEQQGCCSQCHFSVSHPRLSHQGCVLSMQGCKRYVPQGNWWIPIRIQQIDDIL